MWDIYLPLFPSSYLSHSVITTVWIGIMVIAFFNLRFGWIFTGLVVPGYLTPLLLIKPLSVSIILIEGILTYLLIYLLSEVAGKKGWWTNFFGRDRFFAILLASVFMRTFFDGWLLPLLGHWVLQTYHLNLNYHDSLHSFGLIIVALIANQLWKPRLLGGLFQLLVTIGITYFIVRFVLIEYTNFSLSNIAYLYEDVAGSILASPKSYIILIVTAFIASRMNLFYGWEFNGILVPSLLALQWYQPMKIVTSFVEAYFIFIIAIFVLKLPYLKKRSIEGANKLVLFFNIGFIYKILLSYFLIEFLPNYQVSDYFGFGYLLSTLIAVKIYDKVSLPLFTRATLQTSGVSILIATIVGYMLTLIPKGDYFYLPPQTTLQSTKEKPQEQTELLTALEEKKINLYEVDSGSKTHYSPAMLKEFKQILKKIDENFEGAKEEIMQRLNRLHYRATFIDKSYLVLEQEGAYSGGGIYVINLSPKAIPLLIEVPYPLEVQNIIQSAIVLMQLSHAKYMAISSVNTKRKKEFRTSASYESFYHTFHKHYGLNGVLEIHPLVRSVAKKIAPETLNTMDSLTSKMFIKGYLPQNLNLPKLKKRVPNLEISWKQTAQNSLQKKSLANGFVELYLTKKDRISLIATQLREQNSAIISQTSAFSSIEGLLQTWLLEKKIDISMKDSQSYTPPTPRELNYLDHSILTPLYELSSKANIENLSQKSIEEILSSIAIDVHSIGYHLTWYFDTDKKRRYLIFHETNEKKRYWGTYVFAFDSDEALMIQTPRPFYESHTFEYSIELFSQLDAQFLLLSGTHPLTNKDRSSDIMLMQNRANMFNLVSQVIYRESEAKTMNALQIRGMAQTFEVIEESSAVISFNSGRKTGEYLNATQQNIFEYLDGYIPILKQDGSFYTAGYSALSIQALYLKQSQNNTFNTLWLPLNIRTQYQQLITNTLQLQQFNSLSITTLHVPIFDYLSTKNIGSELCEEQQIDSLKAYLEVRDITELAILTSKPDYTLELLIDTKTKQPYLLLFHDTHIISIAKLHTLPPFTTKHIENPDYLKAIELFSHNTTSILRMDKLCVE